MSLSPGMTLLAVYSAMFLGAIWAVTRYRPNPRSLYELHFRIGLAAPVVAFQTDLIRNAFYDLPLLPLRHAFIGFFMYAVLGALYVVVQWFRLWMMARRSRAGRDWGR